MARATLLAWAMVSSAFAATHADWGQRFALDAGQTRIQIYDEIDGVEQSEFVYLSPRLEAGEAEIEVTFWFDDYEYTKGVATACPHPCALRFPRGKGTIRAYVEFFAASGLRTRAGLLRVPQSVASQTCTTNYVMPVEVSGATPFRVCRTVTLDGSPDISGTIRLYAKTFRVTYPEKLRVRVNGKAWLEVKRANLKLIDWLRDWAVGSAANSMDFGQDYHIWTMDLPVSTLQQGNNTIEWEFRERKREEAGVYVLAHNFLAPDVTVSQVSISGTTVTVTTATNHGFSTGNDVLVEGYPGVHWRVNRVKRNITVTGPTTFTFTADNPVAGDLTTTYSGVKVARLLVDDNQFSYVDPATFSVSGGNAATGETLWEAADRNLNPTFRGYVMKASCANCHSEEGRDLRYFNLSPRSIIQRSELHGFTEQEGKHIAAFILANASSNPARPWYSPYQPGPQSDVVSAYDWSGANGPDEILPHEHGMMEQLAANGRTMTYADWDETRQFTLRTTRLAYQFLSIFHLWPELAPQDRWVGYNCTNGLTKGCLTTSDVYVGHQQIDEDLATYCPGAGCAARIASLVSVVSGRRTTNAKLLSSYRALNGQSLCVGMPADPECSSRLVTDANREYLFTYIAGKWGWWRAWDLAHKYDIEQYGSSWFPRGGPENARLNPFSASFQYSPNLIVRINSSTAGRNIPGIQDGESGTENVLSVNWYYLSAVEMWQKNKPPNPDFDAIQPFDIGYHYGYYLNFLNPAIRIRQPLAMTAYVLANFVKYNNSSPVDGEVSGWYPNGMQPEIFTKINSADAWTIIPVEDRNTLRSSVALNAMRRFTRIFFGREQNGTRTAFTNSDWLALGASNSNYRATSNIVFPSLFDVGGANLASNVAHMISYSSALGADPTWRTETATDAASLWPGPTATLTAGIDAVVTTIPISGTWDGFTWPTGAHRIQIGSEVIRCTGRTGNNLTGCTRGADGTTASSASSGATVQKLNRWSHLAGVSCVMGGNGVTIDCSGAGIEP